MIKIIQACLNKELVTVFVDFEKAHYSSNRQTPVNTLRDFDRCHKRTRSLMKQTLTAMNSKAKLQGEISVIF